MFIVGIDIAKHTHQASVMNTDGSLVGKSIEIPNTSVGYNFAPNQISDQGLFGQTKLPHTKYGSRFFV